MHVAKCPSCGARVEFRSAGALLAVCGHCRATLLKRDLDVENLGKMAEVLEDGSTLQVRSEGRYSGASFVVLGRIQLQYGAGFWNEWYIEFADGRTGWLSEGSGLFYVTFPITVEEPLPAFADLQPGQSLRLNGWGFTVTNLETARCIAGEGELPFRVGAGYEVPTVDLRTGPRFATIDYSDAPPLVYLGETVEAADLALKNLREERAWSGKGDTAVREVKCTHCGGPLTLHGKAVESIACPYCGSVLDATHPQLAIISRFEGGLPPGMCLQLGARGKLFDKEFDVLGCLVREVLVENEPYRWFEYLLYDGNNEFRWLTEYDGHWNWVKPAAQMPSKLPARQARYQGKTFRGFAVAQATVSFAAGEFYWRIHAGESCRTADFIDPPLVLSEETMANEITWSVGEYLEPEVVSRAFQLAQMPARKGVAPNQPSPYKGVHGRMWKLFGLFSLAAFLIQLYFVLVADNKEVFRYGAVFEPNEAERMVVSDSFELQGRPTNLAIRQNTDVNNSWIGVSLLLVAEDGKLKFPAAREIAYYHGNDEDGEWTEGKPSDEVTFEQVPPGKYHLEALVEMPADARQPVRNVFTVHRDVPAWSNWLLAQLFLLLLPLFALWKRISFESKRWSESDFSGESA